MTNDPAPPNRRLSRRQLLQAGGLTLGALAVGRPAAAQTPKPGGTFDLGADHRGHRARSAARARALAQPPARR